jgi:hypothetical protein
MAELERGQIIAIPCKVFPGAFNHEAMVIIDSMEGEVSGFVRRDDFFSIEDDHGFVKARVVDVTTETISVMLKGSSLQLQDWLNFHQNGQGPTPKWLLRNINDIINMILSHDDLVKGTSNRLRSSRGSRAGAGVGVFGVLRLPAGLFLSQCALQADASSDGHHVGTAVARRSSCTRRRML